MGSDVTPCRYTHILENLDPKNATAQREVGLVNSIKKLEEQGQSAIDSGHFNTAISLLDRALGLAPSNERAKLMQADAYIRLNNLGQADRMVSYVTFAPPDVRATRTATSATAIARSADVLAPMRTQTHAGMRTGQATNRPTTQQPAVLHSSWLRCTF